MLLDKNFIDKQLFKLVLLLRFKWNYKKTLNDRYGFEDNNFN